LPPRARWRCKIGLLIALRIHTPQQQRVTGCSGDFLPPSPPAEKATASQDQTRQASTGDGASAMVVQKNLAASKKQNKSTRICVQ
jgi:hypothetical protein